MKPSYRPHVRYRALLYGVNISRVFIEGPGTVDGSGAFWWQRSLDTRDSAQPWAPAGLLHVVGADPASGRVCFGRVSGAEELATASVASAVSRELD